jgi:hypothetical protein
MLRGIEFEKDKAGEGKQLDASSRLHGLVFIEVQTPGWFRTSMSLLFRYWSIM